VLDRESQLIWEARISRVPDDQRGTVNSDGIPTGDEHNPGEPDNVDYGAMYTAMDDQYALDEVYSKYEGMSTEQLNLHMKAIENLIEAPEEERGKMWGWGP